MITAFQKDSLEITDQDKQELVDLINSKNSSKFIITHGTDTMVETAKYLSKHVAKVSVLITGDMRPERFSNSDAPINLGCAIATAHLIESGVFIALNGIVKVPTEIKRNLETGQFY